MTRAVDVVLAIVLGAVCLIPCLLIALLIRIGSPGPVLYWSDRVGRENRLFRMPKFRSMRVGTPVVATHMLVEPTQYITPIGNFLRKTSLDELPQLLSVLKGDMSFVGPRPALFNQHDLIALRTQYDIHRLRPGITGWAQINGRDELSVEQKVEFEREYLRRRSVTFDLRIMMATVLAIMRSDGVAH